MTMRREVLAAAAVAAVATQVESAAAQAPPKVDYQVRKMPFDAAKVKGLSEKILTSHYENNYAGAVKRLTAIAAQLAETDFTKAPVFTINGLKREELIAANSMILHELYFDCLGGEGDAKGALAQQIEKDFGSVAHWRAAFSGTGKALGGGSGWVLLAWSPRDKRLMNTWAADHTHNLADGRPILALDMYEHAYHMDYGAKAAAYVDAFMQGIAWDKVGTRFDTFSKQA